MDLCALEDLWIAGVRDRCGMGAERIRCDLGVSGLSCCFSECLLTIRNVLWCEGVCLCFSCAVVVSARCVLRWSRGFFCCHGGLCFWLVPELWAVRAQCEAAVR